jgi:hypothetical protein
VAKPEPPSKSQRLLLIARRCWCQDCVRGPGTLRANGGWKKLNAGGCSRVMFAALIEYLTTSSSSDHGRLAGLAIVSRRVTHSGVHGSGGSSIRSSAIRTRHRNRLYAHAHRAQDIGALRQQIRIQPHRDAIASASLRCRSTISVSYSFIAASKRRCPRRVNSRATGRSPRGCSSRCTSPTVSSLGWKQLCKRRLAQCRPGRRAARRERTLRGREMVGLLNLQFQQISIPRYGATGTVFQFIFI